jgi:hypothetical protein
LSDRFQANPTPARSGVTRAAPQSRFSEAVTLARPSLDHLVGEGEERGGHVEDHEAPELMFEPLCHQTV